MKYKNCDWIAIKLAQKLKVTIKMGLIDIRNIYFVGLGGLGVTCSPRDPRFASSNTAEVDGFF